MSLTKEEELSKLQSVFCGSLRSGLPQDEANRASVNRKRRGGMILDFIICKV